MKRQSPGMVRLIVWYRFTDVSGVLPPSLGLSSPLMEEVSSSETSVNFYQNTPRSTPEGGRLPVLIDLCNSYSLILFQLAELNGN
jgi:hypothetical protein